MLSGYLISEVMGSNPVLSKKFNSSKRHRMRDKTKDKMRDKINNYVRDYVRDDIR